MLCYCCDPANPDRIATHDPAGTTMRFPARFQGPPGNVNGGMAAGALACPALDAATRDGMTHAAATRITARLHRGIPHSRDLQATAVRADGGYDVSVRDGEDVCISGRVEVATFAQQPCPEDVVSSPPGELEPLLREMSAVCDPNVPPFFEQTGDHPISGCFSCGPSNVRGLHIYPRFAGVGVTWASWSPDPSFVDDGGGHVHVIRNESGSVAQTTAVQLIPAGAVRRQDSADPGNCSF